MRCDRRAEGPDAAPGAGVELPVGGSGVVDGLGDALEGSGAAWLSGEPGGALLTGGTSLVELPKVEDANPELAVSEEAAPAGKGSGVEGNCDEPPPPPPACALALPLPPFERLNKTGSVPIGKKTASTQGKTEEKKATHAAERRWSVLASSAADELALVEGWIASLLRPFTRRARRSAVKLAVALAGPRSRARRMCNAT